MQNFITLGQPLLGEKYFTQQEERRKKERNNPKNNGHYIPAATPKGSAHTSLGPIMKMEARQCIWNICMSHFLWVTLSVSNILCVSHLLCLFPLGSHFLRLSFPLYHILFVSHFLNTFCPT